MLQVPLCKSCTTCPAHRRHHCQLIKDAETSQSAELRGLVDDLRATKRGFEHSLTSLQAALTRLSSEKDVACEKIAMTALIQQQKLEKQKACSVDFLLLMHVLNLILPVFVQLAGISGAFVGEGRSPKNIPQVLLLQFF